MSDDTARLWSGELRVRVDPDIVAQPLGDGVVLLHLRTDHFYELNRTGAVLWNLLSAGLTPAQAHQQIAREYRVDPELLAGEIGAMLSELRACDLLVVHE